MIPPDRYKPRRDPAEVFGTVIGFIIVVVVFTVAVSAIAALVAWLWRTIL